MSWKYNPFTNKLDYYEIGEAASLKSKDTTGVMRITGPAAGTIRVITIPDKDTKMVFSDTTGYEIQKDGSDGPGIINFKTS